jgi:hypothetical protein
MASEIAQKWGRSAVYLGKGDQPETIVSEKSQGNFMQEKKGGVFPGKSGKTATGQS